MKIIIKKATPEDAREVKKVHISAYKTSYVGFLPQDFLDSLTLDEEVIKKTADRISSHDYFVAAYEGAIVGFASLCSPHGGCVEVEAIYVSPDYHGKGVGSKLVEHIIGIKKQEGFKSVVAWTLKDGPSIGFYIKNGFMQVDGEEKFWKLNLPIIKFEKRI